MTSRKVRDIAEWLLKNPDVGAQALGVVLDECCVQEVSEEGTKLLLRKLSIYSSIALDALEGMMEPGVQNDKN